VLLGIELQQTRVYQEAKAEGKAEGKAEEGKKLVIKQLTRKLGNLTTQQIDRIDGLSIDGVESLGEALLDFNNPGDLAAWLSQNSG
jgi:predicted transposase YdaD